MGPFPVTFANNTVFDIGFATQTLAGTYTLYVNSNPMDAAGDRLVHYTTQFIITA